MGVGTVVLAVLILLILALVSGFISSVQTAVLSIEPHELPGRRSGEGEFSSLFEKLHEMPQRVLGVILLADTATNVTLVVLALYLFRKLVSGPAVPLWMAVLVVFGVILIFCDLLPKLLGLARPHEIARPGMKVLRVLVSVLGPVTQVLQRWCDGLAALLTPAQMKPRRSLSEDELETLVELGMEEGTLKTEESEIIQEILKLGDKTAKDCITPRVDMFALPDDLADSEALRRVRAARYRRVPIYRETPDEIVGVLNVQSLLFDPSQSYTAVMTPPILVSETMMALELLRTMLSGSPGMAVVVDEYGGTEGIVTLADLTEEVISDAAPLGYEKVDIEELPDGRLLVSGAARLDDLGEALEMDLEQEGLDTIGGLVFNYLGHLPKPGATVEIPPLSVTIRKVRRKRIEQLVIEREAELGESGEEGGEDEFRSRA